MWVVKFCEHCVFEWKFQHGHFRICATFVSVYKAYHAYLLLLLLLLWRLACNGIKCRWSREWRRPLCLYRVSEIKCDDPLNLSISISGGKEIKWDFLSSCEWTGIKPIANSYVSYNKRWGVKVSRVQQTYGQIIIEWVLREGEKPVWLCRSVESGHWRV